MGENRWENRGHGDTRAESCRLPYTTFIDTTFLTCVYMYTTIRQ